MSLRSINLLTNLPFPTVENLNKPHCFESDLNARFASLVEFIRIFKEDCYDIFYSVLTKKMIVILLGTCL